MSDLGGPAKTTVSFHIVSFNGAGGSKKHFKCAVVTCSQCH